MSLFALSDTHLSLSAEKPMDIFGSRWRDHTTKLAEGWNGAVSADDTVVVPGDISWAMTLEDAREDLLFLDSLAGRKIISKGNHDFWWSSAAKAKKFFDDNGITTIELLHCGAFAAEGALICGTRGWYNDEGAAPRDTDYKKLVNREALRLGMSIDAARALDKEAPLLAFLHFPPVFGDYVCRELVDVLHERGVGRCFYGHIHGKYSVPPRIIFEGIEFNIVSADYLNFVPLKISL